MGLDNRFVKIVGMVSGIGIDVLAEIPLQAGNTQDIFFSDDGYIHSFLASGDMSELAHVERLNFLQALGGVMVVTGIAIFLKSVFWKTQKPKPA